MGGDPDLSRPVERKRSVGYATNRQTVAIVAVAIAHVVEVIGYASVVGETITVLVSRPPVAVVTAGTAETVIRYGTAAAGQARND